MRPLIVNVKNKYRNKSLTDFEYEMEFIKLLQETFRFDFFVCLTPRTEKTGLKNTEEILLPFIKLKGHDFSHVDWNEIIPLDEYILSLMKNYEYTALKICSRMMTGWSADEQTDCYLKTLRYSYHILKTHEIDLFIHFGMPHSTMCYIIYALCKELGIPVVVTHYMPTLKSEDIRKRYLADDIENHFYEPIRLVYEENKKATLNVTDDMLGPILGEYLQAFTAGTSQVRIEAPKARKKGNALKTALKHMNIFNENIRYYNKKRREYIKGQKYYNDNAITPDLGKEKYIYYPLHLQPEASTLPLGRYFVEQELVAQMIARCLPQDVYLYVKDHPASADENIIRKSNRTAGYYRAFLDIKNVRLIKRDVNSLELIRNSVCVATITGSAGVEAVFNNKPVLMFGDRLSKYAPGVYDIRTNEDCSRALDEIMASKPDIRLEELKLFLYSVKDLFFDEVLVKDSSGKYEIHPAITNFISSVTLGGEPGETGVITTGIGTAEKST